MEAILKLLDLRLLEKLKILLLEIQLKLHILVLEGEISWVTSSHLGQW